ncbi:acyl-CoA dehydrogenase family protein [Bacillus sp. FJAT-49705]|uniref:Acyl-CoA dehydrogenase family protein n=1 Tax=Cytobacillus citreus TaxID=2833586 RepID=A0ABS5NPM7_9BACI|nr:acyl-CoA dehydrogenase family protein [Cytobacillus citreus]MBS4189787.1 acyl-CoA dehydrogenase family protein [Cytobacillus citreus]
MRQLQLPAFEFTEKQKEFRKEVRSFLQAEKQKGTFDTHADSWLSGYSKEFSKKIGAKGWIGITFPKEYGGQARSTIDRYIITEELLAFGAPVASHWFADRQSGPLILKFGTEEQKKFFIPKIVKGECYFSIGLSEPNSGSDLASLKTTAEKVDGGWIVNGMKTWTSGAHHSHYMITLCRTSQQDPKNRHGGMSQLIIDLKSDGVTIRPIQFLTGEHHFNEVFLENVFVPDNRVVGEVGNGWAQGLTELAFERSGPERILSTFPLLEEAIRLLKEKEDHRGLMEASKLVSRMWALRNMSIGIAALLEEKKDVNLAAALVKDLGNSFEQSVAELIRLLLPAMPSKHAEDVYARMLAESILHGPGFTIRGGTTEILRGIVGKGVISA